LLASWLGAKFGSNKFFWLRGSVKNWIFLTLADVLVSCLGYESVVAVFCFGKLIRSELAERLIVYSFGYREGQE
jgi:hypothetical protein